MLRTCAGNGVPPIITLALLDSSQDLVVRVFAVSVDGMIQKHAYILPIDGRKLKFNVGLYLLFAWQILGAFVWRRAMPWANSRGSLMWLLFLGLGSKVP